MLMREATADARNRAKEKRSQHVEIYVAQQRMPETRDESDWQCMGDIRRDKSGLRSAPNG